VGSWFTGWFTPRFGQRYSGRSTAGIDFGMGRCSPSSFLNRCSGTRPARPYVIPDSTRSRFFLHGLLNHVPAFRLVGSSETTCQCGGPWFGVLVISGPRSSSCPATTRVPWSFLVFNPLVSTTRAPTFARAAARIRLLIGLLLAQYNVNRLRRSGGNMTEEEHATPPPPEPRGIVLADRVAGFAGAGCP